MSNNLRAANGSPIFNALQQLFVQLTAHHRASDVAGAALAGVKAPRKPLGFFKRLGQSIERREMERKEAYLAESTDIFDLEHRMRQLESMRSANSNQWGSYSRY